MFILYYIIYTSYIIVICTLKPKLLKIKKIKSLDPHQDNNSHYFLTKY